ncbi:FKBP-type peptidyl-prolyl cis-trans isomerase [Pseudoalteromonas xiamenensis]
MSTTNIVLIAVIVFLVILIVRAGARNKQVARTNHQAQAAFLAENKQRPEVHETDTGLQYEMLVSVDRDAQKPTATSQVKVHYHGTLLDETVFDSSVKRGQPISFKLNQVISGWTEGLQLMKEGEKVRFFIPSNLAYGDKGVGSIPPGSLLIFDVELIAIE